MCGGGRFGILCPSLMIWPCDGVVFCCVVLRLESRAGFSGDEEGICFFFACVRACENCFWIGEENRHCIALHWYCIACDGSILFHGNWVIDGRN